jgi:hypothetical protein
MLTNTQKAALKAALLAEPDPTLQTALTAGDDVFVTAWCNGASGVDAWMYAASKQALFEACNITQFDSLTQGKRDAWMLLQDNTPVDFRRNKMRNGVDDIWGAAQSPAVLTTLLEKATRAELYITPNIAGNQKTTRLVVGLDRGFAGQVSINDVASVLRG